MQGNAASSTTPSYSVAKLKPPFRVCVSKIVTSRYGSGMIAHQRPASWDDRIAGVDVVLGSLESSPETNSEFKLMSTGGQTPPQPGWVILIDGGSAAEGWQWTLYGLSR